MAFVFTLTWRMASAKSSGDGFSFFLGLIRSGNGTFFRSSSVAFAILILSSFTASIFFLSISSPSSATLSSGRGATRGAYDTTPIDGASFTYRMSSRVHARCESDGGRRDCGSAGGGEDSDEGSGGGGLGLTG